MGAKAMRSVLAYAYLHCLTFEQHIYPGFYDGGRVNFGADAALMIAAKTKEGLRWNARYRSASDKQRNAGTLNVDQHNNSNNNNHGGDLGDVDVLDGVGAVVVARADQKTAPSSSALIDTPPREILVVDHERDPMLRAWISIARGLVRNFADPRRRLIELASVVAMVLGTSLASPNGAADSSATLRTLWLNIQQSETSSPPAGPRVAAFIGEAAGAGVCRHRALLFKTLADDSCLNPKEWAPLPHCAASASASPSQPKPQSHLTAAANPEFYAIRVGLVRGMIQARISGADGDGDGADDGGARSGHSWCVAELEGQMFVVELFPSGKEACALHPFRSDKGARYSLLHSSVVPVRAACSSVPPPLFCCTPADAHFDVRLYIACKAELYQSAAFWRSDGVELLASDAMVVNREGPAAAIVRHLGLSGASSGASSVSAAAVELKCGLTGLQCASYAARPHNSFIAKTNNSEVERGTLRSGLTVEDVVRKSHVPSVSDVAFRRELGLYLMLASSPHDLRGVLPLRAINFSSRQFYFRHVRLGNVHAYCTARPDLTFLRRLLLARAICKAVVSLHAIHPKHPQKKPILHQDLKPCTARTSSLRTSSSSGLLRLMWCRADCGCGLRMGREYGGGIGGRVGAGVLRRGAD
jgi:hypothetical protein